MKKKKTTTAAASASRRCRCRCRSQKNNNQIRDSGGGGGGGIKKRSKKTSRCWPGFEPTPGKIPYSKGSCRQIIKKRDI